jgi:hypothetical protein
VSRKTTINPELTESSSGLSTEDGSNEPSASISSGVIWPSASWYICSTTESSADSRELPRNSIARIAGVR